MGIAIEGIVQRPFEEVLAAARATLQAHGFGVITEIDRQATFRAKLGAETAPHMILGACQPQSAYAATQAAPAADVLPPCNVAVQSTAAGVRVAAVDPVRLFALLAPGSAGLRELSEQVRRDLAPAVREATATPA